MVFLLLYAVNFSIYVVIVLLYAVVLVRVLSLYAVNFSIYVVIDLLYAVVLVRVLSLYAVIFYVVSFFFIICDGFVITCRKLM